MWSILLSSALASEPETEPEHPDLTGTWKMTLSISTAAHIPVLGDTVVVSERVNLVRIVEQDGEILQHHKPCTVEATSEQLIAETTIPDAFVRSLPSKTYPVNLSWDGSAWTYSADLQPERMGYAESATRLPTEAEDDHVEDSDQDGAPGVTIRIKVPVFGVVDAYMVQTAHTLLEQGIVEADTIHGAADVQVLEQNIIGATNALFARQPTIVPVPGVNTFSLERVEDGASCLDL
jgi:hypothetical protein